MRGVLSPMIFLHFDYLVYDLDNCVDYTCTETGLSTDTSSPTQTIVKTPELTLVFNVPHILIRAALLDDIVVMARFST